MTEKNLKDAVREVVKISENGMTTKEVANLIISGVPITSDWEQDIGRWLVESAYWGGLDTELYKGTRVWKYIDNTRQYVLRENRSKVEGFIKGALYSASGTISELDLLKSCKAAGLDTTLWVIKHILHKGYPGGLVAGGFVKILSYEKIDGTDIGYLCLGDKEWTKVNSMKEPTGKAEYIAHKKYAKEQNSNGNKKCMPESFKQKMSVQMKERWAKVKAVNPDAKRLVKV